MSKQIQKSSKGGQGSKERADETLVKKIQVNNAKNDFDFYQKFYISYEGERGSVFTWGSGEMGQLGYNHRIITMMPKDREGYPFQPYPLEIEGLMHKGIYQVAGGDGHTVSVDSNGAVYSWGASACGQLGLSSMKDLPTDIEGYPYQPTPRIVELLSNYKICQIACGDAHTVALSLEGKLYSWGGGGCGQLGHPDTTSMPKDEDGCPYQPKPKLILALKQMEVKEVACGKAHTVAVLTNGHLYSWGAGACGQLGHPDTSSFPADEDGYPYQPIPRCVTALKQHHLIHASCGDVHTMILNDQGEIFCFGGGSCGQLGFGNISQMPLDVDSCPFMPVPKKIDSLSGTFIIQLACGDSHSMALSKDGNLFSWGEATYGQLGLEDIRELPKNSDNKPYQPFPTKVASLVGKKVVSISCGETHTLALTESGHLYSFGGNTCGQLGQFLRPLDKQRRKSWDQIMEAKPLSDNNEPQYSSFMSEGGGSEGSGTNSPRDSVKQNEETKHGDEIGSYDYTPLLSSQANFKPMNYSHQEYGIDAYCNTPKLVKSLLHRKVMKISSGGVHNICIVEPYPATLQQDIYRALMQGDQCDILFKGFYSQKLAQGSDSLSSDEENKEDFNLISREKMGIPVKVKAHQCIIASKSKYFFNYCQEQRRQMENKNECIVIDFKSQTMYEAFRKILDYIYLDDIRVIETVEDSAEVIEMIKLTKQFELDQLFELCEKHFKDLMMQTFDCSNLIQLRQQSIKKNKEDKPIDSLPYKEGKSRTNLTQGQQNRKKRQDLKINSGQLEGMMFLPDGRVLIMDYEVYKKTVENSIICDLYDPNTFMDKSGDDTSVTHSMASDNVGGRVKEKKSSQATQRKQKAPEGNDNAAQDEHAQRHGLSFPLDDKDNEEQKEEDPLILKTNFTDYLPLFNKPEYSDISLIVEGRTIYAHSVILAARSQYFETLFSHDFQENKTREVNFTDVPYEIFFMLMRHIYSDNIKIENKHIYELLALGDRFNIPSFKKKCEFVLAQFINTENVCQIFKFANQFNCERLRDSSLLYVEENYTDVIATPGFEELDKDEMLKIIRVGKEGAAGKKSKRK